MKERKTNYLLLILGLIVALLVMSCEDPLPGIENEPSLEGTWLMKSIDQSNCTDPDDNQFQALICTNQTCITFIFRADLTFEGTYLEDGVPQVVNGTYTSNGNEYTIDTDEEDVAGTFSVSGSELILLSSDSSTGCDVEAVFEKQ